MRLVSFIVISLAMLLAGCTAVGQNGQPPTTQQIVAAQAGNKAIATAARDAFDVLAADIEQQRGKISPDKQAQIDRAEDSIKHLLNDADKAAAGDPNYFAATMKAEGEQEFSLWLQFEIVKFLTPAS